MTDHVFPPFAPPPPVTWGSVLKIWWLMTWRATLGSVLTGAMIGLVVGIIGMMLGWPPPTRTIVISALGVVVGLIWHLAAVRMALAKRYSDFQLTVSPLA